MRALDIFARRHALPTYNYSPRPHPLKFSFILLTELRFESFTPNNIRVPHSIEKFSESAQLTIHMGAFALLQALPQTHPTILAFEVLLSIYIILETIQMAVRYKSSPALFGPIYKADSLTGFWSETWHNVFASPCQSLAYEPIRHNLPSWGVPVPIARCFGVLAAFCLMAIFHVAVLIPLLPIDGLLRVGLFFLLNGVGTVVEAAIWGKRKHWLKAMMAWTFEVLLATWTAQTAQIPNGFSQIPWWDICGGLQ
jgi:Membrane bound O-acyl transferase family